MELIKNVHNRKLEIALEQIADYYEFKLQPSETQKLVSLLREVQEPFCLESTTQIEVYDDLINFLSYIKSLLGAIAEWESEQFSSLKLCRNFLGRIISIPQSEEKLSLCYELVNFFCYYQFDRCDRVINTLAELEKALLKDEANVKGMQLCPSCDKITKGFKGANGHFCGFCGQTLVQE